MKKWKEVIAVDKLEFGKLAVGVGFGMVIVAVYALRPECMIVGGIIGLFGIRAIKKVKPHA